MPIASHVLPHTVTVIEPATSTDGYNATVLDYDTPASSTELVCRLQQDTRAEQYLNGRQPLDQAWTLYTNTDGVLTARSRVIWAERGLTFTVEGEPEPAYNRSAYDHTEATLRIQEG